MTPSLPGSDLRRLLGQQIEWVGLPLSRGLHLRLAKLVPEPAQAATRRDHGAEQQVDSRQGMRHGDQRRLRQAAVIGHDDDRGGSRHFDGDAGLDHARLQSRRGAVHRSGHHRSARPQAGSFGGLDGDFSLNAVRVHDLGELRRLHSAGGAESLGPFSGGVVAHLHQHGVRWIEGEPSRKPVVDVAVHLGELPGPLQNFGFVIPQPEQPRGDVEGVGPVAGDAVDLRPPPSVRSAAPSPLRRGGPSRSSPGAAAGRSGPAAAAWAPGNSRPAPEPSPAPCGTLASASRTALQVACHQSSGSCSTQAGRRWCSGYSAWPAA